MIAVMVVKCLDALLGIGDYFISVVIVVVVVIVVIAILLRNEGILF